MKKLRAGGFDIAAVHNHVLNETPRVIYMHYIGHGKSTELAKSFRAALAESKTPIAGKAEYRAQQLFNLHEHAVPNHPTVSGNSYGSPFLWCTPTPQVRVYG